MKRHITNEAYGYTVEENPRRTARCGRLLQPDATEIRYQEVPCNERDEWCSGCVASLDAYLRARGEIA